MKYSAALLLAFLGLSAASILQQRRGYGTDDKSSFMDMIRRKTEDYLNDDDMTTDDMYNRRMDNIKTGKKADQEFLKKQQTILELLANLQQNTNTHRRLVQMGNEFDPHQNIDRFHNKEAVIKFLKNYNNNNFLDKNEVFTPTIQHHQNQAAQLFTFIHSAQDWETLKQAAAWARNRFNNDQYVFSLTAAVLNHPTTQGIVIPALYEIIPHSFVPATTLHKIYKAKIEGHKQITLNAGYTNQNKNNKNYNKIGNGMDIELNNRNIDDSMEKRINDETTTMWSSHNPNSVFADNDGSINNKAGITENPENKLSYFTEDLGINDLHARYHIQNPVFHGVNKNNNYYTSNIENMNLDNMNKMEDIRRGETFYFAHQQLLARYVLERLSNNLPIPRPINFDDMIKTGYNPNLQHSNGQTVPARPPNTKFHQQILENNNDNNNARLPNNNQAENPQVYEKRLQEVADSGIVLNKDGTKTKLNQHNAVGVLANLLAAPSSSLNPSFYGDYYSAAKNAIGNIADPNNQNGVAPGAVSNYATAARDPAYYQLLVKVNQLFNNLLNKQGPYTKDQLAFRGIKIQNVEVSKLVTYFETLKVNVNNAIRKMNKNLNDDLSNEDIKMKNNNNGENVGDFNVKFQRLANKPFDYKLSVISDKTTDAIVRIFLGPKYDSNGQRFTLPQASKFFVQLDQFKVKLVDGQNTIVRNSQETQINVHDPLSFQELLKRVELARQGQQPFYVNMVDRRHHWGLPLRAQLPKGKREGQQFVLYTIISPVNTINDMTLNTNVDSMEMMDSRMNRHHGMDRDLNTSDERDNSNDRTNTKIVNQIRDNRSIGFPLDRPVVDVNFNTANQYFKTVTIYHKVNNDN